MQTPHSESASIGSTGTGANADSRAIYPHEATRVCSHPRSPVISTDVAEGKWPDSRSPCHIPGDATKVTAPY